MSEKARALLGKRVRVRLTDAGQGDVVITEGTLLAFGDGGDLWVRCDDGFAYYCWPMLDVEAAGEGNDA